MRIPAHEATTAQLGAAYPLAASRPLPSGGVLVGRDLLGGVFVHDPFELYAAGALTNPNMIVFGQIGRGKSALVKTYLYRQAAFGRRIVVLDPKGEYGPLASALGVVPIALRPGGVLRLNPLDGPAASGEAAEETARRRLELCSAIASSALGRELRPPEHTAVELALDGIARPGVAPTLPEVVDALLSPSSESARRICSDVATLRSDARDLALELRRLVHGELRGMFDGPTSPGLALDGPAVVLDLSAVYHSPALGVLVTCAAAAVQSLVESGTRSRTILVVDEAWAVLANLGVARFLQSSWKLARARGIANVAVVHRVSDLAAVGGAGSAVTRLAEGLVADSETIVCYAQPASELELAATALGLSEEETRLVGRLGRGVALWKVAGRSFLVEHRLARGERELVDTDRRLLVDG
ncbi:MAG: ATP-binding protein [Acidimicrobiaceae bacterium]|jgi:type IV secretory pathway VirB4 component|nr:ATP-binding protein [Acidimicrobiaceae bacterium]